MVFRRDNKGDAFHRQISALRQQLGSEDETEAAEERLPPPENQMTDDEPAQDEPRATFPARDASFSFGDFGTASAVDRRYEPAAEPPLPALPEFAVDGQTSVIAHDTHWHGELKTSGSVHVHGRLDGTVNASADVFVAEEAEVDASLTALNVIVSGTLRGTVRCGGRFEVLPQGRVNGDVQAPSLVIHDGAVVAGQIRMGAAEAVDAPPPAPIVQRRTARGR